MVAANGVFYSGFSKTGQSKSFYRYDIYGAA